ncbi:myrosinase 1-like [Planococcus citri]|uniref:myrosinase 1-like n=1 Tax=Planococcus citri TaxID=170843 RepID=UPI0031F9BA99
MREKIFIIFCSLSILLKIETFATGTDTETGNKSLNHFPDDFLFAASTSAYQVEGAWNVDGKGVNIWDRYTHKDPDVIKDGQNADDAAKSYYWYKNDSALLKEFNFQIHRMSISWTRILPNGDMSFINQKGIDHYNHVIDDLLWKGIQPMVIMYHWDLPQKLQDTGGWLNPSIVKYMGDYADLLFKHFGDRVKWWNTLNEPINIVKGYASNNTVAPSLGLGTPADYQVVHNILLAHGRIYNIYKKKYKKWQKGKISMTIDYETCYPKPNSLGSDFAVEKYFQFMVGLFAHPIYSKEGDYPPLVRYIVNENSKKYGLKKSRLPEFTKQEKLNLIGAFDYFSFNHYTSFLCSTPPNNETVDNDSWYSIFSEDLNVKVEPIPYKPKTGENDMYVTPVGFRDGLKKISQEYYFPNIFVTENGYSDPSPLQDYKRIIFHQLYLEQLLKALYLDGCKIIGYTVWSLLDNFQWLAGYTSKFGLIRVDFNSTEKTRTPKLSASWFKTLIDDRKIPDLDDWLLRSNES